MPDKVEKPQPASTVVMSFPQPGLRNAEEYLKTYTGYAYTAVSAIAQEVASIDLHLFKSKFVKGQPETQEVYEHEALSVLNYVNPLTTFYDIIESTQIYLELTGEAFWIVLKQGMKPKELWLIRPDWVQIVPSTKDVIDHYTYSPGGNLNDKVVIPRDSMIHFKYFHPLNPYRGKGSVQAAALPLDIHTFAQEYNRNFFFNSAVPSLVFTTDKQLQEATVKRFVNQWQATYGGRSKSNKVAFLGNGLKMDKISIGGKDMDFTEQQRMMRDDILAVFKVPKTILGLTDDVNRANADATTKAFMERVVTPRMKKIVNTLNEFFVSMYNDPNLFLDFTDPAPEDTEAKLKYYENALKYGWMTPNEVRAEENMEPIDGGDELPKQGGASKPSVNPEEQSPVEETPTEETPIEEAKGLRAYLKNMFSKTEEVKKVYVPRKKFTPKPFKHMIKPPVKRLEVVKREELEAELTPVLTKFIGELLENKGGDEVGIKKGKKVSKKIGVFTEESKVAYWKQFISHTTLWEQRLRNTVVDAFKEQEHMTLDLLEGSVKHWRKEVRKGKESSAIPSEEDMEKIWILAFVALIKEIYLEQGSYVLDFLGVGGTINITSGEAADYLQKDTARVVKEIDTTTRLQLKGTLAEGFKAGESIEQLTKRVKDIFGIATTSRAEMIARTESIRAGNRASVEAYRQSGVVSAKEWLAERDLRTCFPENTMVATSFGEKRIQDIKIGDVVRTGNGLKKVVNNSVRLYSENMIVLELENGKEVASTQDHLYFVNNNWMEAKYIKKGDSLKGVNDEIIKVRRVYNVGLSEANNFESLKGKVGSLLGVSNRVVPVFSVNFKGGIGFREVKVDGVSAYLEFLLKSYVQRAKRFSDYFFESRLSSKFSVTAKTAESTVGARDLAKYSFASFALSEGWRSPAGFTAKMSRFFLAGIEFFAAPFAFQSKGIFSLAGQAADFISVRMAGSNGEFLKTDRADFCDSGTIKKAFPTAEFSIKLGRRAVKSLATGRTIDNYPMSGRFVIALSRAVDFLTGVSAKLASIFHNNILYHKLSAIPRFIPVYNLEVEKDHTFFANGVLVHNCPFCEELDGKVVGLNEDYLKKGDEIVVDGQKLKIDFMDVSEPPAHCSCRCTTIPILIGE